MNQGSGVPKCPLLACHKKTPRGIPVPPSGLPEEGALPHHSIPPPHQVFDTTPEGMKLTGSYRITHLPATLIIDPITGEPRPGRLLFAWVQERAAAAELWAWSMRGMGSMWCAPLCGMECVAAHPLTPLTALCSCLPRRQALGPLGLPGCRPHVRAPHPLHGPRATGDHGSWGVWPFLLGHASCATGLDAAPYGSHTWPEPFIALCEPPGLWGLSWPRPSAASELLPHNLVLATTSSLLPSLPLP